MRTVVTVTFGTRFDSGRAERDERGDIWQENGHVGETGAGGNDGREPITPNTCCISFVHRSFGNRSDGNPN